MGRQGRNEELRANETNGSHKQQDRQGSSASQGADVSDPSGADHAQGALGSTTQADRDANERVQDDGNGSTANGWSNGESVSARDDRDDDRVGARQERD